MYFGTEPHSEFYKCIKTIDGNYLAVGTKQIPVVMDGIIRYGCQS